MTVALLCFVTGACQDKDTDIVGSIIEPIDASFITGELEGNDYVWTWTAQAGLQMQVSIYKETTVLNMEIVDGNTYIHQDINTNVEYIYVFKLTDGTNFSRGVTKRYMREGASPVSDITMSQVDKEGGYDVLVRWTASSDADNLSFSATNGSRNIRETLSNSITSYVIENVFNGDEWKIEIVANNGKGPSLPTSTSLRIGKTAIGFFERICDRQGSLLKRR